jgi:protein-disulfide isomerase
VLSKAADLATVIAALIISALAVDRWLLRSGAPGAPPPEVAYIDDWRAHADSAGIWTGNGNAPVVLVEFMDAQCPFCAALAPVVDSLHVQFGDQLAVVVLHWPLDFHEHAKEAAVAWECAHRQGRFYPMLQATFAEQQAIGVRDWSEYAEDAGVADLTAFAACAALPADSFPRIARGVQVALQTRAAGTPTVWINGRRVRHDGAALREAIQGELDAR